MKKVLCKIGGVAKSHSGTAEESGAAGEHDPPPASAVDSSARRFSMGRFTLSSVQIPARAGASSNRSIDQVVSETDKIRTTKNPLAAPGRRAGEDQHREWHSSSATNDSHSPTPPSSVASLPPDPVSPCFTAAASRQKRVSLSLNPSGFRAFLKSATQGNATASPYQTNPPGEGPLPTGEAVDSGVAPARQARPAAAKGPSQQSSQHALQSPEPTRRGIRSSLSSKFRRASSTKSSLSGVEDAARRGRDMPAAESGNGPASGRDRDDSGLQEPLSQEEIPSSGGPRSSPPQPPRKLLRRRVSISFSPSSLKKAIGLTPSQDSDRITTMRSEDSRPAGDEPFAVSSGTAPPPFRVHPHPPGVRAAIRAANTLSPTAVRAAMRSTMAWDSSGGTGGIPKNSKREVPVGRRLQADESDHPVFSTRATVAAPEPTPPPPLAYQQQAQRRLMRSVRRSASFSAGTRRSATAIRESRGRGKVVASARDTETSGASAVGIESLDTGNDCLAGSSPDLLLGGGRRPSGRHRGLGGRSMSLSLLGRASPGAIVGSSNQPSPPSFLRGDGSGSRSGNSRSPGLDGGGGNGDTGGANGGFRQRLRQRAAGVGAGGPVGSGFHRRSRTRSASPPQTSHGPSLGGHGRTISASSDLLSLDSCGNWAGPGWRGFGGADGCGGVKRRPGGLPSILDAVPVWKRTGLLKGLQEREAEFTSVKGVGIFVGTWNVNAKKPNLVDPLWLHEWVCPEDGLLEERQCVRNQDDKEDSPVDNKQPEHGSLCGEPIYDGMEDVYAIGFQELVDLNAVNVTIDIRSQKRSVEWEQRVVSSLNLAALQQANKRRRASVAVSPPSSRCPSPPGGKGRRDAHSTVSVTSEARVAVGKTRAKTSPSFESGDGDAEVNVAGGAENTGQQADEQRASAAPTTTAGSPAPRTTTSTDSPAAEDSNHGGEESSLAGGGATTDAEGGKGGADDGGSCAALLASNGGDTFVLVAKEHLVGTWLAVFVRKSVLQEVSDVRTGTVSAGMMGVMGNKGGVGIRFRLRSSSLCFVTSHLAAHRENVKARNENYHKILREMVFAPLPDAEWRRPQQQQQQRRASSIRSGGSSAPSSPLSGRRLSVSPRLLSPSGSGSPSQNSRRRLSMAASSLSGILSPRNNADSSPSSLAKPQRVTSRSLSPSTSPDNGKEQRSQTREQRRRRRREVQAESRSRCSSPDRTAGGGSRRRSMGMSWSAGSLSSMLPSSSLESSPFAATLHPSHAPAARGAPGQLSSESLSPRLAVTVIPAATNVISSGRCPMSDSVGGTALSTGIGRVNTVETPATGADTEGYAATAADGVCHRLAVVGGGEGFGQKDQQPTNREEEAAEEGAVGFSGRVPNSPEDSAAAKLDRSSGARNEAGDTETLSHVYDKAEAQEVDEVGVVGVKETSPEEEPDLEKKQDRGEGEPTQVLCVPEIATRDTDEFLGVQDHDVVFWFGDLNYRIESSVAALEVLSHAVCGGFPFLAANDQLNSARETGAAFEGFHEDPIDFPPTYKYTAGTDEYDTRNDKKFRAPAWCDRILSWTAVGRDAGSKASPKEQAPNGGVGAIGAGCLRQLAYRRSETPMTSDHKPVSASFRFGCKQVDTDAYAKVLLELVEKAARGASDGQLQVDIVDGGNTIDFGDLRYGIPQIRSAWIVNSGRVPACFGVHSSRHPPLTAPDPDKRKLTHASGASSEVEAARCEPRVGKRGGEGASAALGATVGWNRVEKSEVHNAVGVESVSQDNGKGDDEDGHEERAPALAFSGFRPNEVSPAALASGESGVWCSVSPKRGIILPGEKLELQITALVEGSACRAVVNGPTPNELEDILVLRVEGGSDRYISVGGKFAPSVYGRTLQDMTESTSADLGTACESDKDVSRAACGGVVSVDLIQSVGAGDGGARRTKQNVGVPRQLWRMVEDLLQNHAYQQPGLFVEKGVEQEVQGIHEAVVSGSGFPQHCAHSMAEALIALLASLSVPIVPENVCQALSGAKDVGDIGARARSFVLDLPPLHRDVFVYLVSFFKVSLAHATQNGLTAERLLSVQRSCFLPDARRRPYLADDEPLRSGLRHGRRQPRQDGEREEARTRCEAGSSIGQNQQCHVEGGGAAAVEPPSADEGRGLVAESEDDLLGLVLHHILTGS